MAVERTGIEGWGVMFEDVGGGAVVGEGAVWLRGGSGVWGIGERPIR